MVKKYKQWLLEVGFVDVVEQTIPVPRKFCESQCRHDPRRGREGVARYIEPRLTSTVGAWPSDPKFQDVGRWHRLNVLRGLRGVCWKLFRSLGMTPEEIEDIVEKTKADLDNTSIHSSHVA